MPDTTIATTITTPTITIPDPLVRTLTWLVRLSCRVL